MPRELLVCVGRMLYANHALSVLFPLNLRLWEISRPKSSILHMNEKMGLAHEKALLLQISECPLVWYSSLVHFCVHNSEELFPFWNINFIAAFCITPGIFLSNYPWFIPKRLLLAIQSKMCLGSFILVATVSLYFFSIILCVNSFKKRCCFLSFLQWKIKSTFQFGLVHTVFQTVTCTAMSVPLNTIQWINIIIVIQYAVNIFILKNRRFYSNILIRGIWITFT